MKYIAAFVILAAAAVSSAQDVGVNTETSIPYSNIETLYTTETNSLGVVTGMPDPVTTQPGQPAEVTSQPAAASIYAGLSQGLNTVVVGNSTVTVDVNGNQTSIVSSTTQSTAASASAATTGSATGSATGSSSTSKSSSAAANIKLASGALAGAAGLFAVFL